jgi:hypothetical protein
VEYPVLRIRIRIRIRKNLKLFAGSRHCNSIERQDRSETSMKRNTVHVFTIAKFCLPYCLNEMFHASKRKLLEWFASKYMSTVQTRIQNPNPYANQKIICVDPNKKN